MTSIINLLSTLISPPYCTYCKRYLLERIPLCPECHILAVAILPIILKLNPSYSLTIYARSEYKDPLRSLVLAKGRSNYSASKQLAQIMLDMPFLTTAIDYFIPVPLHWTRYASRGYNQAEVIAQTLGKKLCIPTISLVKRIQKTPQQSRCTSVQERANNVEKAFTLQSSFAARILPTILTPNFLLNNTNLTAFENKHLVLVDDLMTTGATLTAVAKILLPLKPARISAIVACRVCN